ncbi:hypothetical protein K1719_002003 [Acacia pycnantha]|nr:hypothetical protein K1719_002003 [Acacia pycnantha]
MLECLWVTQCSNLKHLVPSSVTFSHLTYLEVADCNGLIRLITSSTARSLVKLARMKITNCNSLEQVVAEEREGSGDEIAFNALEVLELECLPMIGRFCSSNCVLKLQRLKKVVVQQCPRMSIFSVKDASTPMLQGIPSKEVDGKIYWEGDLNRTINKMFSDMVAFPEAHIQHHRPACSVQRVHLPNLETIVIGGMPELKTIWQPFFTSSCLDNLKMMQVSNCGKLDNIFPSYMQRAFVSLETLMSLFILEEVICNLERGSCYQQFPKNGDLLFGKNRSTKQAREGTDTERRWKEHWQGDLNATVNKIFQDMVDQVVDTPKQEITNLPSSSDDRQQKEDVSSTYPQDAEIYGTIQTDQDVESLATKGNTEESHGSSIEIQERCDTIKKPSISVAQNVPSSSSNMIPDAATMYPSPSQAPELAIAQSTGPQESEICPKDNLFNQPKIIVVCDNNEVVGSQEIRETMDEPLIQSDQHAQKLATTENTGKDQSAKHYVLA